MAEVTVTSLTADKMATAVRYGAVTVVADEPEADGGEARGPSPYELLLGALGACTTMTLQLYARRKGWPLQRVEVRLSHAKIHASDCATCETKEGYLDDIRREISLTGDLSPDQRKRLLEIADRCPVSQTLRHEVRITDTLV